MKLSRRALLRNLGIGSAAIVASACQPKIVEVTKIVEKEVEKVVQQTVVVEKEKIVEKEKVVKETVVVEAKAAPVKEVKITHWNGFTGYDRPCLENLFNLFNSFREDIEIEYTIMPWDGIKETLAPAWSAGEGPDFILIPSVWMPAYAQAGLLKKLDDFISGPNGMDADANVSMCMDCHRLDGVTYGVCMGVNNWALYYNKDILEAAGWDPEKPPTTTDELIECAKKCKKGDVWGFPVPYTDTTYMFSSICCFGGNWVKDGKVLLDKEPVIQASNFLTSFVKDGLAPEGGGDMGGLFQAGKSPLYLGGPWMTGGFTAAGLNYAVTEWVQGTQKGTQGGALGYAIYTKSPNAAQAWDFMKWWQGDEVQIPWCECSGYPSANPKLVDHPRIKDNKLIAPFQRQAIYAEAPGPAIVPHAEIERIWIDTVEKVMYGEDPKTTWAKAAEETRAILREAGQLTE